MVETQDLAFLQILMLRLTHSSQQDKTCLTPSILILPQSFQLKTWVCNKFILALGTFTWFFESLSFLEHEPAVQTPRRFHDEPIPLYVLQIAQDESDVIRPLSQIFLATAIALLPFSPLVKAHRTRLVEWFYNLLL